VPQMNYVPPSANRRWEALARTGLFAGSLRACWLERLWM
jgi:hypothetical protein